MAFKKYKIMGAIIEYDKTGTNNRDSFRDLEIYEAYLKKLCDREINSAEFFEQLLKDSQIQVLCMFALAGISQFFEFMEIKDNLPPDFKPGNMSLAEIIAKYGK